MNDCSHTSSRWSVEAVVGPAGIHQGLESFWTVSRERLCKLLIAHLLVDLLTGAAWNTEQAPVGLCCRLARARPCSGFPVQVLLPRFPCPGSPAQVLLRTVWRLRWKPTFKRPFASHDFPQNDSKAVRNILEFALKTKLKVRMGPQVGVGGAVAVGTGSPVNLTLFAVAVVDVGEQLRRLVAQQADLLVLGDLLQRVLGFGQLEAAQLRQTRPPGQPGPPRLPACTASLP